MYIGTEYNFSQSFQLAIVLNDDWENGRARVSPGGGQSSPADRRQPQRLRQNGAGFAYQWVDLRWTEFNPACIFMYFIY
jgi:hypothetical protein